MAGVKQTSRYQEVRKWHGNFEEKRVIKKIATGADLHCKKNTGNKKENDGRGMQWEKDKEECKHRIGERASVDGTVT